MEKEKEDLTPVLNECEIHLQNAEHDVLIKEGILAGLTPTVTFLQESEHQSMEENKSFILVQAELVNKSRQAPHFTRPDRREKVATSVPIHFLGLAVHVDDIVPYLGEREGSELQIFQTMMIYCGPAREK